MDHASQEHLKMAVLNVLWGAGNSLIADLCGVAYCLLQCSRLAAWTAAAAANAAAATAVTCR